jgi:hypothetical protein
MDDGDVNGWLLPWFHPHPRDEDLSPGTPSPGAIFIGPLGERVNRQEWICAIPGLKIETWGNLFSG